MKETWKSPRKVEEEIRQYQHDRFERFMDEADRGLITREMAIAAIQAESMGDNVVIGETDERVHS